MTAATPQTAAPPEQTSPDRFEEAKGLVVAHDKASTSWLQRQLRVGYNVASALIERMEREGVVSAPDHVGRRTVIATEGNAATPSEKTRAAATARVIPYLSNGSAQISIPVDLPEEYRAADDRYRLLVERIERLEEEKKGIGDDIKDVYSELKSVGYDAKVTRQIVRLRKMRPDDRREMESILELYKTALGIT